jgi:hypothetical protein
VQVASKQWFATRSLETIDFLTVSAQAVAAPVDDIFNLCRHNSLRFPSFATHSPRVHFVPRAHPW